MRDRMPPEMLAKAKQQATTTNNRNQLALMANGFGVTRQDKKAAHAALVAEVGERKAAKLMRAEAKKQRGTF